MDDLLFLAHRIPYPPRKGDKIRSYHLLMALTSRYRVHLGAFVDDPEDHTHMTTLAGLCTGETLLLKLNPWQARLRALRGLLTGSPLTLPYYDHPTMRTWVKELVNRHPIRRVVVYSAAVAQFVTDLDPAILRVSDFVDVDSDKWALYAAGRQGFWRWLYQREARTLLAAERRLAAASATVFFVSPPEAALFQRLAPELAGRIDYWENGVDLHYFSPDHPCPNPYPAGIKPLVFTGAMDYWPNVDAVTWFAKEVFARIADPEARLVIVGGRPVEAVVNLGQQPGVMVIGNVPDVRPWIRWSVAAVAPLRIARGVQNKVLEAMAMARPVLATSFAMEGIRIEDQRLQRWVADTPETLLAKAVALLNGADATDPDNSCGVLGRQLVEKHYHWERNLQRILSRIAE
ncbi:MAG: TIGR03087 family PEP-CTERM/XrtA system glycosyltransferase [Magnetococcales bacterium]|nr:TIGR03087 family PEP-CTERM/XrtA system glycosyltransferase [Magnetococcales bacterium]NGZ07156.1 TIGR03087 family PEP-CTERM/XrtA system glycosyltransferase [Magnetococcales bacterium]